MGYTVLILVDGHTANFEPLSSDCPKILYPLAGKPLVSHMVDSLMNQLYNEVNNVYFLGNFSDSQIFDNILDVLRQRYPGIQFQILNELSSSPELHYFNREIFRLGSAELLVVRGNIISNYPFREIIDMHRESKSMVTLLGINPLLINDYLKKFLKVEADDYDHLPKSEILKNYGTIVSRKLNDGIDHYVENPSEEFTNKFGRSFDVLINGGIYVLDKLTLYLIEGEIETSSYVSLESALLKKLHKSNKGFSVYKSNDFWYQLKTSLSAMLANNYFLSIYNQNYAETFNTCRVGPNVSVGENVRIGTRVRIKNAIIGDNVIIGSNTIINNAIISKGVIIGDWCRIEGSINNSTVNRDINNDYAEDEYINTGNNVVILGENSIINDRFVFNSIMQPSDQMNIDL